MHVSMFYGKKNYCNIWLNKLKKYIFLLKYTPLCSTFAKNRKKIDKKKLNYTLKIDHENNTYTNTYGKFIPTTFLYFFIYFFTILYFFFFIFILFLKKLQIKM